MQNRRYSTTILRTIRQRKLAFFGAFVAVFFVMFGFLSVIGLTPELRVESPSVAGVETGQPVAQELSEAPIRVVAPAVGLDDTIANPQQSDIETLDRALLKSSVRYPGSALLNEDGNVLLFGHSSYLRTTLNPAYKAFNDIQKLKTGEAVYVYSETAVYEYRVTSVKYVKAEEGVIDLQPSGKRRLTLVTCNSFADKSDRFVVEAEFVQSYSVGN